MELELEVPTPIITTTGNTNVPTSLTIDHGDWVTIQSVRLAEPDDRSRTLEEGAKCGGSYTGTPMDQCMEGLFCQYQTPLYAKCVKDDASSMVVFQNSPPCGGAGTKCMGDQDFLDAFGATGICCKDGLRCIFQELFVGICADPKLFLGSSHLTGPSDLSLSVETDTPTESDPLTEPEVASPVPGTESPDTRPRTIKEHKKCGYHVHSLALRKLYLHAQSSLKHQELDHVQATFCSKASFSHTLL